MPRLGVIGSMVWDEIHGRDPLAPAIEEWGGIAYALSGLDAALPDEWEIVPLIKVGTDLAPQAQQFLRTLRHVPATARFIEVPSPNQRVTLRYETRARRCEQMTGGVPGWKWPELGPMVADLDALYVNYISGFEMCLGTTESLRRGFRGPIYADLHSLFLSVGSEGFRELQPLPNAATWFSFFDIVQCNEEELAQLGSDPLVVAASALAAGVSVLNVTLGPRGVVYFADSDLSTIDYRLSTIGRRGGANRTTIRTQLLAPPPVDAPDPTGCGDVFGATCFARLLGGDDLVTALMAGNLAASRNAQFRGATHLAEHLRGHLVMS